MVTRNEKQSRAMSHGFTVVELLIVIVVIGILAAIAIVAYNGIQDRAHSVATASNINMYAKGLELYKIENSSYPTPNTWENRHDSICIGLPPSSGNTSCGTGIVACGGEVITGDIGAYYSTELNELMEPHIGSIPHGIVSKPYNTEVNAGADCKISATYTGAVYSAKQRIVIYENADGTVAYTASLVASDEQRANVYTITYGATNGECTIPKSFAQTGLPGFEGGLACVHYGGDPQHIEFTPYVS